MNYPWLDFALNLALSLAAVFVLMALVMGTAIRIRNQSIIDIFWGPGFGVIAVVSFLASSSVGSESRRWLVMALTVIWALRLGLYIGRRNAGHAEDKRYTRLMATRKGSLVPFLIRKIYGLQGVLMFIVSLPVQFAMYIPREIGILDYIAVVVWVIGFLFEAIGDWQLARFKANPANTGKVMDKGLWGWTRHPNYFGDVCVWWGLFLFALASPWGLLTIISPIIMNRLLVSYSGKALLERGMRRSKGESYEDYIARTSGFFPRPPKRTAAGRSV